MDVSDSESSSIISYSPAISPRSVGDYSDGPSSSSPSLSIQQVDGFGWDSTISDDSDDSDSSSDSSGSLQSLGSLQHPPPLRRAIDSQSGQSSSSPSSSVTTSSSLRSAASSASGSASASASGSSPGIHFASSPEGASDSRGQRDVRPPRGNWSLWSPVAAGLDLPAQFGLDLPRLSPSPNHHDFTRPRSPAFRGPARHREVRAVSPLLFRDMEDRRRRRILDDQLVEMEVGQTVVDRMNDFRDRNREPRRGPLRNWSPAPRAVRREPAVIDLTEEPDSPVEQHRPAPRPLVGGSRNPRRQMSQNHRTPSLSRSDGSILVEPPIIDLTEDSPEDHPAPHPARRRHRDIPNRRSRPRQPPQEEPRGVDEPEVAIMGIFARLEELGVAGERIRGGLNRAIPGFMNFFPGGRGRNNLPDDFEVQVIGAPGPPLNAMDNPLQGNPVLFNYQANGWGNLREPTPKPPHVPPPAAKEGFTRNTGEDVVVVCASCEEELKYDPDAAEDGPPAKKVRTRKDREEHHFWALPACGHVYCRQCYENRTNTGKKDKDKGETLHFRLEGKLLRCAVDDCETDARPKKSWVGIFI